MHPPKGIKSAISAIDAPEASRIEVERAVLSLKRQMGWIVFTDSMDPDGDVVAVRASGLTPASNFVICVEKIVRYDRGP